jgi:hypothetical protein
MALAALGFRDTPFHDPFHGGTFGVPAAERCRAEQAQSVPGKRHADADQARALLASSTT